MISEDYTVLLLLSLILRPALSLSGLNCIIIFVKLFGTFGRELKQLEWLSRWQPSLTTILYTVFV